MAQDSASYATVSQQLLNAETDSAKLFLLERLKTSISSELINEERITPIDSSNLLFELISKDKKVQIVTWGLEIDNTWEYYGYVKTYNGLKKVYNVYELISLDFRNALDSKNLLGIENWPAGVYTKLIENEYNNRNYYTLLGWLAPKGQTAFKFIEVMSLSKSGQPYFGRYNYFKKDKTYERRVLFAYKSQSTFHLDYGKYDYTKRQWNRKKRKYLIKKYTDYMIVFDHLVSEYPGMDSMSEFSVPSGNAINAYKFERGKWLFISDIDARNLKQIK